VTSGASFFRPWSWPVVLVGFAAGLIWFLDDKKDQNGFPFDQLAFGEHVLFSAQEQRLQHFR